MSGPVTTTEQLRTPRSRAAATEALPVIDSHNKAIPYPPRSAIPLLQFLMKFNAVVFQA